MQEPGTAANGLGRLTLATWSSSDGVFSFTEAYAYSAAGLPLIKKLTITDSPSQIVMKSVFTYDGEGREWTVLPPGVDYANNPLPVYHFDRDALGRPVDSFTAVPPNTTPTNACDCQSRFGHVGKNVGYPAKIAREIGSDRQTTE